MTAICYDLHNLCITKVSLAKMSRTSDAQVRTPVSVKLKRTVISVCYQHDYKVTHTK